MGASPRWKVYTAKGVYVAACKSQYLAAQLMNPLGVGATIREGHSEVVYKHGHDQPHDGCWDPDTVDPATGVPSACAICWTEVETIVASSQRKRR